MTSEIEMLRQDFRIMLNEVYELRRLLQGLDENHAEYMSVPRFAREIGLSSTRVRFMCTHGKLKAIQPANDRGRWKILSTELVRLRNEAKANNYSQSKK